MVRAAQYRRLQKRAAERKAAADAEQDEIVVEVEAEQAKTEMNDNHEVLVAEQTNIEKCNATPKANVAAEARVGKTAAEAVEPQTCELCDNTFGTLNGLRAHIGKQHKAIPQVDGSNDVINEPTYCKVCRECPDEIETSEDINIHLMNDHQVMAVLETYGQEWASQRQYCIRRWSPFEKYFGTP